MVVTLLKISSYQRIFSAHDVQPLKSVERGGEIGVEGIQDGKK